MADSTIKDIIYLVSGTENPNNRLNGKINESFKDGSGSVYRCLGGNQWRIEKKNNVSLLERIVDSISELKSLDDVSLGETVKTNGYYSGDTNGSGSYTCVSTTSAGYTDDGGVTIIASNNYVFKLNFDNNVSFYQYGARSNEDRDDTTYDSTLFLQKALDSEYPIVSGGGYFYITDTLSIMNMKTIQCVGTDLENRTSTYPLYTVRKNATVIYTNIALDSLIDIGFSRVQILGGLVVDTSKISGHTGAGIRYRIHANRIFEGELDVKINGNFDELIDPLTTHGTGTKAILFDYDTLREGAETATYGHASYLNIRAWVQGCNVGISELKDNPIANNDFYCNYHNFYLISTQCKQAYNILSISSSILDGSFQGWYTLSESEQSTPVVYNAGNNEYNFKASDVAGGVSNGVYKNSKLLVNDGGLTLGNRAMSAFQLGQIDGDGLSNSGVTRDQREFLITKNNYRASGDDTPIISKLDNKLSHADKFMATSIDAYNVLDGTIALETDLQSSDNYIPKDTSGKITFSSTGNLFSNLGDAAGIVYSGTHDTDNSYVEIVITGATSIHKLGIALHTNENYSRPKSIQVIQQINGGSRETTTKELGNRIEDDYLAIFDLNFQVQGEMIIRLIGNYNDESSLTYIKDIFAVGTDQEREGFINTGTDQLIFGAKDFSGGLKINSNSIVPEISDGSVIDLSNINGINYGVRDVNDGIYNPSSNSVYTFENEILNGKALVQWDSSFKVAFPTISGAYKMQSDAFSVDRAYDMHVLCTNGVHVEYWFVDKGISPLAEQYTQDNSASRYTEVNSTTGWLLTTASISSDDTVFYDGNYSLKITANSTSFNSAYYNFEVITGAVYKITMWVKSDGSGADSKIRSNVGFSNFYSENINSTEWVEKTFTVTANITGTAEVRVYSIASSDGGSAGDHVWVDRMSINKIQ